MSQMVSVILSVGFVKFALKFNVALEYSSPQLHVTHCVTAHAAVGHVGVFASSHCNLHPMQRCAALAQMRPQPYRVPEGPLRWV